VKRAVCALVLCAGNFAHADPPQRDGGASPVRASPPTLPPAAYLVGDVTRGRVVQRRLLDLDDDGVKDLWTTAQGLCNVASDCVYAVQVGRRDVGLVAGREASFRVLDEKHGGLRDLVGVQHHMGKTLAVRYRFDGARYVGAASRVCRVDAMGAREVCEEWKSLGERPLPPEGWPGLFPHEYAP
jgi:hypothetical protein